MRLLITLFAGLLGLAFGSFLNVCLSRWPAGESVVRPGSHCRSCARTLTWWENLPLVSWIILRGRCRTCGAAISWRYPLVELAVGALWALLTWRFLELALAPDIPAISPFLHYNRYSELFFLFAQFIFLWLLVALAALDAENLWLPDWLTYPGIAFGIVVVIVSSYVAEQTSDGPNPNKGPLILQLTLLALLATALPALLILLIRWTYQLLRKREGIGLGDAKLMAMLGAWLGLEGALVAFALGVLLGAVVGVVVLIRSKSIGVAAAETKLPLGTFLCAGGILVSLWGHQILAAYMRLLGI